jgi:hypothetical protein
MARALWGVSLALLCCCFVIPSTGCASSTTQPVMQPVTQAQMVVTARFENTVLSTAENRLVDAMSAGLLPKTLKDELDVYVRSCRAAVDRMNTIAHAPPPPDVNAFQLALDQFTAAMGPIAQANANAVQAKRVPPRKLSAEESNAPPSNPSPGGHVPPSALRNDASRLNVSPSLPAAK